MKHTKLVVDYDFTFPVFAIISDVKEYKLAYWLNKNLNINLSKSEDIELEFVQNETLRFSNFTFETEYSTWTLIRNKSVEFENSKKPYLLPELKKYDYIIHIGGSLDECNTSEILASIRSVPSVVLASEFVAESLKSKENLIYN